MTIVTPDYSPARTLMRAALQHPNRISLVWGFQGEEWSLKRSALAVRRLASVFSHKLGIGERIAIIGPNSPWHFLVHVAASWSNNVTVPLSPRLPLAQLADLLDDCRPCLIITTSELAACLPPVLINTNEGTHASFSPTIWTFEDLQLHEESADEAGGTPPSRDEELAAIVYTSGSSGTPRGVELTHSQLWWASLSFRDGFEYSPGTDVIGVCAPLSHIGGFNGTTLDAFAHGGTLVVLPGFEPVSVLQAVEKYRITQMFLVPVMCHLLADAQDKLQADLSSYRNPLIGGDSMSADLEARLRSLGLAPIHVWGMTETGGAGALLSSDVFADHEGAIGLPFPYIDLRLVSEDGRILQPGHEPSQVGEIQVRGPGVTRAYYRRPLETESSCVDDWLRTGDLASYDEQGFVHMVGRASRMIHTAGEMVPPTRVETALRRCQDVADALVVGIEDDRWGHIVAAVLVPSDSPVGVPTLKEATTSSSLPRPLTEEELARIRHETEDLLAPWEVVRTAMWVQSIPVTSTGKPNPRAAHDMLVSLRK